MSIRDVQGGPLQVKGKLNVEFTIENATYSWECIIIERLDNEILFGTDFMKTHKIILDMETSNIIFTTSPTTISGLQNQTK